MPSLLVTVFVLQLFISLINAIGAPTINELLWRLYNKFPVSTAKSVKESTRLKAEVIRLKTEMSSFSAQDQFARWAKLDRQHGKAAADFEKCSASLNSAKSRFDSTFTTIRWISTNGARMFLQFWYSKQPIFWLPVGSVPGYVEWILSCPKAPIGSVSIQIWGIACASVMVLISDAIIAIWAFAKPGSVFSGDVKGKSSVSSRQTVNAPTNGGGLKKEL